MCTSLDLSPSLVARASSELRSPLYKPWCRFPVMAGNNPLSISFSLYPTFRHCDPVQGPCHGTCPDVRPFLSPVRSTGRETYGDTTAGSWNEYCFQAAHPRPQLPADGKVLFNHRESSLPASTRLLQAFGSWALVESCFPPSRFGFPPRPNNGFAHLALQD